MSSIGLEIRKPFMNGSPFVHRFISPYFKLFGHWILEFGVYLYFDA
jgi:hypothetical protein